MTSLAPASKLPSHRSAGWAAIASGALGIVCFGLLAAYLVTAPKEVLESEVAPKLGAIPLLSWFLLKGSDVGFIFQALLMAPVAIALEGIARQHSARLSRAAMTVGVISLGSVALLRMLALLFPEQVSGILFMGPTGFVGVWLVIVNWILGRSLSRGLRITGTVAGAGLLIQGASFFFLGGLAVLFNGPESYASDVDFHNWNAIGGVPGGILYWIWAILLGRNLLRAERRHVA